MRLMIDTNIFLDVLAEREPFFKDSKAVLDPVSYTHLRAHET